MTISNDIQRNGQKLGRASGLAFALAASAGIACAGSGGTVLPPGANSHGYTLTDMTKAVALFTTSGNNPAYYPTTPFQVLFADPDTEVFTFPEDGGLLVSGGNSFTVPRGTPFYLPIDNADDSPPIAGVFPTDPSAAADYIFDPAQVGGRNFEVIVDGQRTPIDAWYLAGPVETPPLLDGGGTHIITLGTFLSPMSIGTHTVTIRGGYYGDLVIGTYGLAYIAEDLTYVVRVVPPGKQ